MILYDNMICIDIPFHIWDVIPTPLTNSYFSRWLLHHQPVKVCHVHYLPAEPNIAELVSPRSETLQWPTAESTESTWPRTKERVLISSEQMVAHVYRHVMWILFITLQYVCVKHNYMFTCYSEFI